MRRRTKRAGSALPAAVAGDGGAEGEGEGKDNSGNEGQDDGGGGRQADSTGAPGATGAPARRSLENLWHLGDLLNLRDLLLWPLLASLVVAMAAPYVGRGSLAALVAQTANPHNVFQAGTLRLTSSRAGQALFTVEAIGPTSSNVATSGATVQAGPPSGGLAPGTTLANSLTLTNSGTLPAGELRLFVPEGGIANTNDVPAFCDGSNTALAGTPDCGRQRLSDALELLVYYPVDAAGTQHVCVYGGNAANLGEVVATDTAGVPAACGFGALSSGLAPAAAGTADVATASAVSRLRAGVVVPHAVSTDTVQAQWPAGQSRTVQVVVRLSEGASNAVVGARSVVSLVWTGVAQAATGTTAAGGSEGGASLGVGGSAALAVAPDAPASVSAIAGDGEATVVWAAPAFDGGRPITGYTVTAVEDTSKTVTAGAGSRSARLTGLTNGTSYTFAVRATNALGPGAAGVSAPVTPVSARLVTTAETWTGTRSFTNLTIKPGGNVTHSPWDTTLDIRVTGTLRIEAGGSIDVSSGGCWGAGSLEQPGRWWNGSGCTDAGGSPRYVGGSYGGLGGGSEPNATYGTAANPIEVGSGGGSGYNWPGAGGTGGGLVRLTAGALHLDGALRANGTAGGTYWGAGGSGGGIYVSVATLSGTGAIEANGGRGGGGGGGGGRIAVLADVSTFSGAMNAYPGEGTNGGGAGTVFTSTRAGASPRLVVDGNSGRLVGAATPVDVLPSGTDLVIRNGARFVNAATRPTFGSLTVSGNSYAGFPEGTTFGDVTVNGTATVEVAATSAAPLSANSVDLRSGARLTHYHAHFSVSPPSPLGLFVQATGAVTVDATSAIDVSGKGCWGGSVLNQPGRWWNGSGCTDTGGSPGSVGGSYGGLGGGTAPPNATYGTDASPMEVGSGGGHGWNYPGAGGIGGGLVRLTAGALHLDGALRANGTDGGGSGAAGGSGGGIYVNVGTLSGTGPIEANGGRGQGGGGGGRVAVVSPNRGGFSGPVSAAEGIGAYGNSGRSGTVYYSP